MSATNTWGNISRVLTGASLVFPSLSPFAALAGLAANPNDDPNTFMRGNVLPMIARVQQAYAAQQGLNTATAENSSTAFVQYHNSSPGIPGGGVPMMGVLPGGLAGAMQQSAAVRNTFSKAAGRRGGKRSAARRKKKARASAPRRRVKAKRGNKFTKGSAAAKAHMAKLRRMRKKK